MTPHKGQYKTSSLVGWRTYTYKGRKITDYHYGKDTVGLTTKDLRAIWDCHKLELLEGYNSGRGNLMRLYYSSTLRVQYQHLAKFKANAATRVKQGDVVGVEGSTGQSTGSHLHSEVQQLIGGVWTPLSGALQTQYTELVDKIGGPYTGNDTIDGAVTEEKDPDPAEVEPVPDDFEMGKVWVPRIEIARGGSLELFTEPNVEAVIKGNGPGTVHNGTLRINEGHYIGLEKVTIKGMPAAENASGYKILAGGEKLYVATGLWNAHVTARSMEQIVDEFGGLAA